MCDGVFTEEKDYVFIATTHDSQKYISTFLEESVLITHDIILENGGISCRDLIYRIICNYYLSPCGTEIPPSSICPEDCSAVQMECPVAWKIAKLGFKEFINCDDTSALLFPLPNCCKGLGIQDEIQIEEGAFCVLCDCSVMKECACTPLYY